MKRLLAILKTHYLALIFALIVGLGAVAPHLFFIYDLGDKYKGINVFKSSDEEGYLASVQVTSLVGGEKFPPPYLYENRNIPAAVIFLSEIILGKIVKYTRIEVVNLFLLLKFFGPFLIFILLYWLVYAITKNKVSSILAPTLIIIGMGIIGARPGIIWDTILWRSPSIEFWDHIRLLNPAFSGIFFFLTLVAVLYLFFQPTIKKAMIAGSLFGILFYLYLYFWTFVLALLGVILLYALFAKAIKLSVYTLVSLGFGILIGLPQVFNLFVYLNKVTYGSSGIINLSVVSRHGPLFEKVVLASLTLYVLFLIYLRKRGVLDRVFLFPLFLLITGTIAVNQQLITGKVIQPHHYYFFTNLPSAYIALAVVFGYVINLIRQKYSRYSIVAAAFLLVFAWGIGVQASSYKYWAPKYREYQNYGEIFNWLKQNAPRDSVIYGNDEISDLISAYTPFFVYWNGHAGDSVYPPMERKERVYFIRMRLNNVGVQDAEKYLRDHREEIGWGFYGQYYRDLCGTYGCFPDEIMDSLIEKYKDFLRQPFEQEFKKYKVDYFVWDKTREPDWPVENVKFLIPVFESQDVIILKIK